MEHVKNLTRMIRMGRRSRRNRSKVVSARYRVCIRPANAALSLCRYTARSHRTVFATYSILAEFTMRRLRLYTVLVSFRAGGYRPLFELCGNFFHLLDGGHVF
jgi:hypothetical protein